MFALDIKDFQEFGCPRCGSKKSKMVSYVPEILKFFKCDNCGEEMAVIKDGNNNTAWMYTNGSYQELHVQEHPLKKHKSRKI